MDSRLQSIYRIAYRLAELVYPLSIHSPPKRITDISAEYPEVHAILFVGHLVLTMIEPGVSRSRRGMKPTLIVVRRIATTPKTAGAGVMLDASFPMFTRPIATSSERIAPLCFVGCFVFLVMVAASWRCWRRSCGRFRPPVRAGVPLGMTRWVRLDPFGGKVVMIGFAIAAFEVAYDLLITH